MTNNPAQLRSAATALLSAAEMLEHNDAIFKGKWKKGSKAWSGDFIERTVKDGLGLIGAGRVTVTIPRAIARELGLLKDAPNAAPSVPEEKK